MYLAFEAAEGVGNTNMVSTCPAQSAHLLFVIVIIIIIYYYYYCYYFLFLFFINMVSPCSAGMALPKPACHYSCFLGLSLYVTSLDTS